VSVVKLADLRVGVLSCGSRIDGNMNEGDDVYPGSGPLYAGKTLHPALVYIEDDVSSTSLIYLEIIRKDLTLGLGESNCVEIPSTS
jgi:hypothetical protein